MNEILKKYFNKEFMLKNKSLIIKIIIIMLFCGVGFAANHFGGQAEGESEIKVEEKAKPSKAEDAGSENIVIDISGAVKHPRVVHLSKKSRIEDAIKAAGGLTVKADISKINRAAFVKDGDKIYIPKSGEETSGSENSRSDGRDNERDGGKVNLNTADAAKLQTVNGIGPATAEKIIDYRENNGNFKKVEDLVKVPGIGPKTVQKLIKEFTV